jgi:phenylalanyl-tRNA synthetase alpha subunit
MEEIQNLLNGFHADIKSIASLTELDNLEIKYLGRNGMVNDFMKKITSIAPEQKKEYGAHSISLSPRFLPAYRTRNINKFLTSCQRIPLTSKLNFFR